MERSRQLKKKAPHDAGGAAPHRATSPNFPERVVKGDEVAPHRSVTSAVTVQSDAVATPPTGSLKNLLLPIEAKTSKNSADIRIRLANTR